MPLESFYGGKQGVSPIVKARFEYVTNATDPTTHKYIDEAYGRAVAAAEKENDANLLKSINKETMECCFADPNYTDVWYGELAIINTKNKRNPNNGKLFRRTLNGAVNNEDGVSHAEYIGTIVGPSEGFPFIEIAGSTEKLKEKVSGITSIDEQSEGFQYGYPTGKNTRTVTYKFDDDDKAALYEYEANVEEKSLVPGAMKNSNGEWTSYEKGIKYSWVNVRNNIDGTEQDTYVYLGFKVPYTIFDFNFDTKPWNYEGKIAEFLNESNYLGIKPTNDTGTWESTPFYQKWQIHLLRGKPGNQVGYLRRVEANTFCNFDTTKNVDSNGKPKNPILYSYNSIFNTNNAGTVEDFVLTPPNVVWSDSAWRVGDISISSENYLGEEVNAESDIIVYTVYAIDKNSSSSNGISQFDCYLGKTKDIRGITLNEDGTLNINYSDATSENFEKAIKWIKSINTTSYTLGNNVISGLSVTYNTITKDVNGNDVNDSDFFIVPYVYDMRVGLDNNNGNPEFNIQYTKVDSRLENDKLTPYITGTQILKDGWNTSNPFKFSFLKSLKIDADTQELVYATSPARHKFKNEDMPFNDWANNTNDEYWTKFGASGVYLNNIDKVTILNGYLYVLYSSSEYRYNPVDSDIVIEPIIEKYVSYPGKFTIDPNTGLKWKCSSAPSFKPNKVAGNWKDLWWVELGRVEQPKNGVWISTEFDKERFVKYFNTKFPNKAVSSWNAFSFTSDYNAVLDIMNGKWPTKGSIDNVDIDGGWTIIVNDKSIETNPYKDGHIYLYEKAARDNNNEIDLTLSPNNDQTGNLVKNGDNYFYFDYNWRMWRLAGTFTSGISGGGGSGNAEWPIFISTIKNNQSYLIPPYKDANIDINSLILVESQFQVEESYLDNIF